MHWQKFYSVFRCKFCLYLQSLTIVLRAVRGVFLLFTIIAVCLFSGCKPSGRRDGSVTFDESCLVTDSVYDVDELLHLITYYDSIGDEKEALAMRLKYGCAMREMSQLEAAIDMHDACIVSAARIKDTLQLVNALNNQVMNFCIIGNMHEAQKHQSIALMLSENMCDYKPVCDVHEHFDRKSNTDYLWSALLMSAVVILLVLTFLYLHLVKHHKGSASSNFNVNDSQSTEQEKIISEMAEYKRDKNKNIETIAAVGGADAKVKDADRYILIASEDDGMAMLITSVFENNGYQCEMVGSIDGALQQMSRHMPSALIVDLKLATENGMKLVGVAQGGVSMPSTPVVVTSVQVTNGQLLESIPNGVESYFGKPFIPEELLLKVCRLLKAKEEIQAINNSELVKHISDSNRRFIEKVDECINENIMRSDLNATMLAKYMLMSIVTLNRKIKIIANTNTTNYIRRRRLEKAKFMLLNTNMTMGEIQVMCGFDSPSYFSRAFKTEYGVSPTEYRKG